MGWLKELFSSSVGTVIEKLGDAIDANVTNDEERMTLTNELAKIKLEAELAVKTIELKYEEELSKRHTSDMQSDDVWSKRVRPMSLIYLLGVISILSVTDGNLRWNDFTFVISSSYIDLFQALLMTAFGFYFGGRSVEKIAKIIRGGKTDV